MKEMCGQKDWLLKDFAGLGDQTIVAVSRGFARTSV